MQVVKVRHEGDAKEYLFQTEVALKKGQEVTVDTFYGTKMAVCSCDSFFVPEEAVKDLESVAEYYWPIKQVVGVFVAIDDIKGQSYWVPTEDYLPECGKKCIVTTEDGDVVISEVDIWNGKYIWRHPFISVPIKVKAWMYMPKEYEEDDVEEDA